MKFLAMLLFAVSIFSFISVEEKIPWSEDYKLKGSDFKSPNANGISFVATTSSGISYLFPSTYNSDSRKQHRKLK